MEKKRQNKILAIVAICIALLGMGFSYASMSTKLDIKGFATISSANWDVHFENLSHATLIGQAIEKKHPTITDNSTSISTYDVMFQAAKDGISYDIEIVNGGGIDAKITSLNISKPICKGSGISSSNDEQLVCNNLQYTIKYLDGTPLKIGDILKKGTTTYARLKLVYEGSDLPFEEVRINDLGITILYSQN